MSSLCLIHLKLSKESIDIQKDKFQKMILGRFAKIMVSAALYRMQLVLLPNMMKTKMGDSSMQNSNS